MRFNYDGAKIRALREHALLSREALASLARMSPGTLYKIETQKQETLSERDIEYLATALSVHPDEISEDYYPPTLPYINRVRYDPETIRSRRKALGQSLAEIAERTGLSLEAVSRLEHKDTAQPETVRRVCRGLGIKPQDVAPVFKVFPAPVERIAFEQALGPDVFVYPEEGPPCAQDEQPPEISYTQPHAPSTPVAPALPDPG